MRNENDATVVMNAAARCMLALCDSTVHSARYTRCRDIIVLKIVSDRKQIKESTVARTQRCTKFPPMAYNDAFDSGLMHN